ncbi:MAG: restriction endonuclease subunit S [Clostridia bacterium]|nr:restriction endonuclease subunit S [Clostridia bacterium]
MYSREREPDYSWATGCIEPNAEISLSDREWAEFKVKDIFDVFTGGDLIISKVCEGNIPVISHSKENNGVAIYSDLIPGRMIFDCNKTISLADRGNFYSFVQGRDFYVGTRVKALVAKYPCPNKLNLLFITSIINCHESEFNYGRNCCANLPELSLLLPVSTDGKPDYEFMEQYMKSLPFSKVLE